MTVDTADSVAQAIRDHHTHLAADLHERTAAVLIAAQRSDITNARDALHAWYRTELLPHIVAEEQALYTAASELDSARLLVRGMLDEHRALVSLVAELALAQQPFEVATAAASAQTLFDVHLAKENDLLLPALDAANVDLAALLDGMHAILGSAAPHADGGADADTGAGCGCGGCGCGNSADENDSSPALLQISAQNELDVRTLPHGQRHEIIFERLQDLAAGEALVIVNDHDPKPLRYQATALWPDRFEWTYREAGPEVWRVAITRVG